DIDESDRVTVVGDVAEDVEDRPRLLNNVRRRNQRECTDSDRSDDGQPRTDRRTANAAAPRRREVVVREEGQPDILPPVVRHRRTIMSFKPRSNHSVNRATRDSVNGMATDGEPQGEDEFRELMREFLAGNSDIDPVDLARAAG